MNYFELYDLPIAFNVDEGQVKRKFYELSKKYHPDFFIAESEEKQQEILELSTLNNKGYQVLSNPLKRIEYVLGLHDLIVEGEKYQLPQSFLMEMMEVNEALMEQEFERDAVALGNLTKAVDEIESRLFQELHALTGLFDTNKEADKSAILLKIKDLWYRQKYLLRIRDSLNRLSR